MSEIHARSALGSAELTADELRAVILMALPYVGVSHAASLHSAAEQLVAEGEHRRRFSRFRLGSSTKHLRVDPQA